MLLLEASEHKEAVISNTAFVICRHSMIDIQEVNQLSGTMSLKRTKRKQ
jgi:hypothetical protein